MASTAALAATGGLARAAETYRIAVPLQGLTAEFMQLWLKGANAHPAVTSGMVDLTVFDGKMDALTQINQFDTIITQQFDAIIFIPVDIEAGNGPAAAAKAAGIPVIGSNTVTSDTSSYRTYIGSNDVTAGRMVAQSVIDAMGGKGALVVMEGMIGQSAQVQRREGIAATLAKHPDIEVIESKTANWSRAEALALMENWMTAHPGRIGGVIAHNDEMAIGALEAIKARGADPKSIPVGGIDGITDALLAVKRGELMTTLQDANAQAQGAIDLALRTLVGETYAPQSAIWEQYEGQMDWAGGAAASYAVPWVPVTASNVDALLALRRG